MSRTRRSAWGVASGLVFTGVTVLTGMIATPLLLQLLGEERFGASKVLNDWMLTLALFELGLSGALMAHLAERVNADDSDARVGVMIRTGLGAYARVVIAILAAGVPFIIFLPQLLKIERVSPAEARIAGAISLAAFLLLPFNVFRALGEARQRGYLVTLLMTAQALLTTLLSIIFAWLGWGMIGQSLAYLAAQVPTAVALVSDGLRRYPAVLRTRADLESKRALWSLNRATLLFNLSSRFGLHSDNIIVSWALGPAAVVPFFVTQRLATITLTQLQSFGNSTWAGLVELHARGESEKFRRRFLELTSVVSGLGAATLTPIAAFNFHFVSRWVGSSNYAGDAVTLISCLNIWIWAIYSLWGWLISGTGNIASFVPYAIGFMILNVIVSVAGTFAFGLVGPLLGTFVAFALVHSWALPRLLQKLFGLSPAALWLTALKPLLWGLPYAWFVIAFARRAQLKSWAEIGTAMAFSGLLGLLLWWSLSLDREARGAWRRRLASVINYS